ncbi:MAG: cytochrome c family protein [Bacteroidota bacterium]
MLQKKSIIVVLLAFLAGGALLGQNFKYIGASKCKMCHMKPAKGEQYKVWLAGPHAGAMKTLASEASLKIAKEKGIADPTTDPACIKCHSTVGHIEKSQMASIKITEGVSCESCHGPGSMYKGASVMKNRDMAMKKGLILPTEEVCKTCHNEESPTYKPFNYEEKVALIAHPDPTKE